MITADSRVAAQWKGFEAVGGDPEKRSQYLRLDPHALLGEIPILRAASERGCIEYKTARASQTGRLLEQARYRTLLGKEIQSCCDGLGTLAYIPLIQRLMCNGSLHIRDTQNSELSQKEAEHTADVKLILAEVQRRVKDDPKSREIQEIKTILLLLSRYQRELRQTKDAAAGAPSDRRAAIAERFKQTSSEILGRISQNYKRLETREKESARSAPKSILLRLPIKELVPLYRRQCKLALELKTRIEWAHSENERVREALISAGEGTNGLIAMYEEEFEAFCKLGGDKRTANQLAQAFSAELQRRLELEHTRY
ncbi:MAG: hypothetical protein ACLFNT_06255 [Spirochaetales bacterium]